MGKITVQFPEEKTAALLVATDPASVTADHARLVVRRTVIGDVVKTETRREWDSDAETFVAAPAVVASGSDYTVIADINQYSVPSTSETYAITAPPAADDYTTQPAITPAKSSPLRTSGILLQDASDNLAPFTPSTVTGAADPTDATGGKVNFTFTPPVVTSTNSGGDGKWHLGFTGTFYIDDRLLNANELNNWNKWICSPQPTDTVSELTPQGGVGIIFNSTFAGAKNM